MKQIYLDYNATTPIIEEVAEVMKPYLDTYFGNPSSSHSYGIETKLAVENAREQVSELINCVPEQLIFTSGGSEANNYAIKGYAFANQHKGNHIITSSIEHPAVIEVCRFLETKGFEITYLPVNADGVVEVESLKSAITQKTILISIMHANNEVGVIQPIAELTKIAKEHNIAFHCDAAQSVGKIQVDVQAMGVDLLTVAAHKFYGPKGIGALFIANGIKLEKLIHGADHERNLRAGTENILEIVGMGKAAEVAKRDLQKNINKNTELRNFLENRLSTALPNIKINGVGVERLPNTASISFPLVEANTLIESLQGVAASAGAACHTDSVDVSAVLEAMAIPMDYAMGTIRFSVGHYTTKEEIITAMAEVENKVKQMTKNKEVKIEVPTLIAHDDVRLTKFTSGGGCACKLRPQDLEKVLQKLDKPTDAKVLVGKESSDDACVYSLNDDLALVQTLDFFTPIVDDPYYFGAIAATNALSDIYAMGAKPIFALNIVGFPQNRLPLTILEEILRGAQDKAKEAGINILGGHSIDDNEPKYGMVVSGLIHPDKIMQNIGAHNGDLLILTKPLGTGIISSAVKKGVVSDETRDFVTKQMATLNRTASETMLKYDTHAATDVTGFGLLGHLREMVMDTKLGAELDFDKVPFFEDARKFATAGIIPAGSKNNLKWVFDDIIFDDKLSDVDRILLADAQTSGGLLIAVNPKDADALLAELISKDLKASLIGKFTDANPGMIRV